MALVTAVVDRRRWSHDVSILIAAGAGVGRCFGSQPRAKVSMMIMRPPQHGHGRDSTRGSSTGAASGDEPRVLSRPCPCCGGRMIIIETFARGCEPKHRPTPAP